MNPTAALSLLTLFTAAAPAFAGAEDLRVFRGLARAGATLDPAMGHVYIMATDLECAYSYQFKTHECVFGDSFKGKVNLDGAQARRLARLMKSLGASEDAAMGRSYLSIASIQCAQLSKGHSDESATDRTSCTVIVAPEENPSSKEEQ